ncbi:hypothetical protein C8R46DRAFT_1207309 [Mycena filopes]|nr:hypothetical protein C8R46DRAFT_1207309 [Mycena filopes]
MPDPALTSEVHRNVYLLPRSIQLNQTVTILPVLRLPSLLRPHLSVVLWSQAENADEAFKVELWADFNDHEKHRVAFGRYPSNDMKLESLIPIGVTNWSYMSVVSKAIEITLRGPPYQSNSLHIWAKDRQSFAEELGHAIITPGSKGPTRSLKTETGPHECREGEGSCQILDEAVSTIIEESGPLPLQHIDVDATDKEAARFPKDHPAQSGQAYTIDSSSTIARGADIEVYSVRTEPWVRYETPTFYDVFEPTFLATALSLDHNLGHLIFGPSTWLALGGIATTCPRDPVTAFFEEQGALDMPTFLRPDYYAPMLLEKAEFSSKSIPVRTIHTYRSDKQIWSITPPATNSQGMSGIRDSADVTVVLGEERRCMLFSYIVKHTQKVAIGPLEYCGNAHRINIGSSTRAVPCYGDPSLSEFYAERDLKRRLLPTAIPGERRPSLGSAAMKTLKSQLSEVATSRVLKRARDEEGKENNNDGFLKALGLEDDVDGGKAGIGFKLSLDLKFEICVLFRTLQRCRTWESWQLAKQTFHEGLKSLLGDVEETSLDAGELSEADDKSVKAAPKKSVPQTKAAKAAGLSCFEAVKAYFDTNWFNERWIAHFTDIGMPSDQSRDGVWNTNNWSETAFKQFNTIFLDNKHNKRYEILLPSQAEVATEKKGPHVSAAANTRMREDATADAELDRVTKRLEKAPVVTAPDPYNGMDFGDSQVNNSGGRPRRMRALQPWRARGQRKYAAPGIYSYSPRFVKKHGPPKTRRLARNSVFPATNRLLNARRAFWMHQYRKAQQLKKSLSDAHFDQSLQAHDNNNFLNAEDLTLGTFSFDRWIPLEYELCMDEMAVFTSCLNESSFAREAGIIFLFGAPNMPYSDELRKLDWTQPLSVEALRTARMGGLADLVAGRHDGNINQLVFFQLIAHHWTVYHHNFNRSGGGFPTVRWFNSLPESPAPLQDIQDQVVVQQYFVHPRSEVPPPRIASQNFFAIHLNLQHDVYTCGFWAVYVAFAILLGFNPDNNAARELGPRALKELTGSVYAAFLGDEVGVSMALMQGLFARFNPAVFGAPVAPNAIMSHRPTDMARVLRAPSQGPSQSALPKKSLRAATPPLLATSLPLANPVLTADYGELVDAINNSNKQWDIANTTVRSQNLHGLDILVNTGAYAEQLPFHVLERWDCEPIILGPRASDAAAGMPPPPWKNSRKGPRKYWISKFNIFEKDRLIIPVFWKSMKHWLLAVVFFQRTEIRIYDSIYQPRGTCARAVYHRIMEMLLYEHLQRYQTPLPGSWNPQYGPEASPRVPQQNTALDCAIFTIRFGVAIAQGRAPDAPDFDFKQADAQDERIRIANRISVAIRADRNNHRALGILPPTTESSETASPLPDVVPTAADHARLDPDATLNLRITDPDAFDALRADATKWVASRQLRPYEGHYILLQPPVKTSDFFFPARIAAIRDDGVLRLEWSCGFLLSRDGMSGTLPDRPVGTFTCTLEEWRQANNQKLNHDQLLPLEWPAALTLWGRTFRSFVPACETTLPLLDHLHSQFELVVSTLNGDSVPDTGLMAIMGDASATPLNFLGSMSTLLWKPSAGQRIVLSIIML